MELMEKLEDRRNSNHEKLLLLKASQARTLITASDNESRSYPDKKFGTDSVNSHYDFSYFKNSEHNILNPHQFKFQNLFLTFSFLRLINRMGVICTEGHFDDSCKQ